MNDYTEAIRLNSQYADAYDRRAWLWATCPDARYRDGQKAVQSAARACELTLWKSYDACETLAAAYAEAGDFGAAVYWQSKAIALLDDKTAKDKLRTRLELYVANKPYHQAKS